MPAAYYVGAVAVAVVAVALLVMVRRRDWPTQWLPREGPRQSSDAALSLFDRRGRARWPESESEDAKRARLRCIVAPYAGGEWKSR